MTSRRISLPAALLLSGYLAAAEPEEAVLRLAPMMTGQKPPREWAACASDIRRHTEGRVRVEWSRPDGRTGEPAPALVYGLPLRFRSFEDVDRVRAEMDERLSAQLLDNGMVVLGFEESGFAYVLSTRQIRVPADLAGAKVWAPAGGADGPARAAGPPGVKGVPLKLGEVRKALLNGDVDTVVFPPLGAIVLRWHTPLRHVLDLPFAYLSNPIVVGAKVFPALSQADRQTVRQAVETCLQKVNRKARAKHSEALDVLRMQGVDFVVPTDEEKGLWSTWAADVTDRLAETGRIDRAAVELMDRILAEKPEATAAKPETN